MCNLESVQPHTDTLCTDLTDKIFIEESLCDRRRRNTDPKVMTMAAPAATAVAPEPAAPSGPLYIDTQHDDMVHDAQLDHYGCKLATSSSGE